MRILITGAAGNLGSRLAQHLISSPHHLRLLVHKSQLPFDVSDHINVSVCRADLAQPATLTEACAEIDCIVHFAGVLFAPLPGKFLPKTNVGYVKSLMEAANTSGVRKFILISFPQVEGETIPSSPATGRLDAFPTVIHFRTRLEAERYVLERCANTQMIPVIFRSGMVYGPGVKMVEGARWMLRHRLMAVWTKPTWAHLISLPDFLAALQAGIENDTATGIYQICDDSPITLQDFLDKLADHYHCPHAWRLPAWMFHFAGLSLEMAALLLSTAAPLNRDIIRAGMTSCAADNSRMKQHLLAELAYPTIQQGIELL